MAHAVLALAIFHYMTFESQTSGGQLTHTHTYYILYYILIYMLCNLFNIGYIIYDVVYIIYDVFMCI